MLDGILAGYFRDHIIGTKVSSFTLETDLYLGHQPIACGVRLAGDQTCFISSPLTVLYHGMIDFKFIRSGSPTWGPLLLFSHTPKTQMVKSAIRRRVLLLL